MIPNGTNFYVSSVLDKIKLKNVLPESSTKNLNTLSYSFLSFNDYVWT